MLLDSGFQQVIHSLPQPGLVFTSMSQQPCGPPMLQALTGRRDTACQGRDSPLLASL